ncbi:MAG TPA: diaminopimelate epimerase [Actinobacteria bacterium]|nr:diaminopimelate epimerase [Actinomycetota bacterium]
MRPVAEFSKWQGIGNDYVIVATGELPFELGPARVSLICDRHYGIGADGVLAWSGSSTAEFRMDIFNPDGSRAEMCGNGIRMLARHLYRRGLSGSATFTVDTDAGVVTPTVREDGMVRVKMGRAAVGGSAIRGFDGTAGSSEAVPARLEAAGQEYTFTFVDMGNPHCVIVADDLDSVDLEAEGPAIENHQLFPERANVEFLRVDGPAEVTMKVWERGVGETRACGTGACAVAVAACRSGKARSPMTVHLPGGDLEIEVDDDLNVTMTGPAEEVYSGNMSEGFIKRIKEL